MTPDQERWSLAARIEAIVLAALMIAAMLSAVAPISRAILIGRS